MPPGMRRVPRLARTAPASLAALLACALACPRPAAAEEDFFEPEALGMGGAVRALGVDTTAVRLNPAAMVGIAAYASSFSYSYYGRERSHLFSTAAFDSRTSLFALGASYSIQAFEPPFDPSTDVPWYSIDGDTELRDRRTWHRWDIAAAYGIAQRRVNIGLTARILRQRFDLYDDRTRFTMDGGLVVWATQALAFQFSAQNFIPTTQDRFPTRLTAGAGFKLDPWLKVAADVVWDMSSQKKPVTDLRAGAELTILQVLAIRAGYYSDRKFVDHYLTWGLGICAPRARISFAMRIELGPMDKRLRDGVPEANNRFWNTIGFEILF
jgi:hypothetical protein